MPRAFTAARFYRFLPHLYLAFAAPLHCPYLTAGYTVARTRIHLRHHPHCWFVGLYTFSRALRILQLPPYHLYLDYRALPLFCRFTLRIQFGYHSYLHGSVLRSSTTFIALPRLVCCCLYRLRLHFDLLHRALHTPVYIHTVTVPHARVRSRTLRYGWVHTPLPYAYVTGYRGYYRTPLLVRVTWLRSWFLPIARCSLITALPPLPRSPLPFYRRYTRSRLRILRWFCGLHAVYRTAFWLHYHCAGLDTRLCRLPFTFCVHGCATHTGYAFVGYTAHAHVGSVTHLRLRFTRFTVHAHVCRGWLVVTHILVTLDFRLPVTLLPPFTFTFGWLRLRLRVVAAHLPRTTLRFCTQFCYRHVCRTFCRTFTTARSPAVHRFTFGSVTHVLHTRLRGHVCTRGLFLHRAFTRYGLVCHLPRLPHRRLPLPFVHFAVTAVHLAVATLPFPFRFTARVTCRSAAWFAAYHALLHTAVTFYIRAVAVLRFTYLRTRLRFAVRAALVHARCLPPHGLPFLGYPGWFGWFGYHGCTRSALPLRWVPAPRFTHARHTRGSPHAACTWFGSATRWILRLVLSALRHYLPFAILPTVCVVVRFLPVYTHYTVHTHGSAVRAHRSRLPCLVCCAFSSVLYTVLFGFVYALPFPPYAFAAHVYTYTYP